jgi:uncharacterized protein (TIGR04255 family)
MADPLPEFEAPPVTEVAISIQFSPLANWRGGYAGLFWSQIKDDYPHTQTQPPLPPQNEDFEALSFRNEVNIQFMEPDLQRIWFLSEDGTKLIQVQKDRFVINWRIVVGDEKYPHYEPELRVRFIKEWGRFRKFVRDQSLGQIEAIQAEVTYVNDFVQGEDWNLFPESACLLSNWASKGSTNFLPALETLNLNGSFRMPSGKGRLHFAAQHVLRQRDSKQVVQLRLVARGIPESTADDDVLKWIDFSREWIVCGFTDLTSNSAHKLWKRIR